MKKRIAKKLWKRAFECARDFLHNPMDLDFDDLRNYANRQTLKQFDKAAQRLNKSSKKPVL